MGGSSDGGILMMCVFGITYFGWFSKLGRREGNARKMRGSFAIMKEHGKRTGADKRSRKGDKQKGNERARKLES